MSTTDPSIMNAVDVTTIPPLQRPESIEVAANEVARYVKALKQLDDEDWAKQTVNTLWDVRAMSGHVLGMTETFTGIRRFVGTMRAGTKAAGDGPAIDGITALQVEATAGLTTSQLIERLEVAGPRSAAWRGSRRLMRKMPLKQPMNDGTVETWRLGFLVDTILTRDTWMHRSDLAQATDRPIELTADHDGRIVADVVAEWARRHGKPFRLHLTGPAGGHYHQGDGGDEITIDAVEFCRILSARGTGDGLLRQEVPF